MIFRSLQKKIQLYYHTLKPLRPHQIYERVWAFCKRRFHLYGRLHLPESVNGRLLHRTSLLHHDPWNSAEAIRAGTFVFLNQAADLGWPMRWEKAGRLPLLWRFNLHYFHFLYLLTIPEQEYLCLNWVKTFPQNKGEAWHPYPTSLRIVEWIKSNPQHPVLQKSIYEQAAFLSQNMETFHPGNHLLENAQALIFAGLYFSGDAQAGQWLKKGLAIIEQQTPAQVLDDGGYFERSTMYHSLMLELYLNLLNILPLDVQFRPLVERTAQKMLGFLQSTLHPDGQLALFNDSTTEIAPSPQDLVGYAERLGIQPLPLQNSFPSSGFFVMKDSPLFAIIDAGPIGPDHLPAHAHADIFSFELSLGDERFITDTGVFEYAAGARRNYCRSTAAHNTVEVDGQSQAEVWSSFRVARRFLPEKIQFIQSSREAKLSGEFPGWGALLNSKLVHERSFEFLPDQGRFVIKDLVKQPGNHDLVSRLHLAPGCKVEITSQGCSIRKAGRVLKLSSNLPPSVEESPYYPRFGLEVFRPVLIFRSEKSKDFNLEITLSWEQEDGRDG